MSVLSAYVRGFYDGPHATPKDADEGPIFLGIKNVTPDGRLDFSDIKHVSEQEFPRWTKRVKPQKGDVVFSYEATLHRYALIPEGFEGCLGRRMALIRPDPAKLDSRFLHFYLLSPQWRNQVDANVITGATVNRLPLTKVPNFNVNFPELPEQQRIATILSAYDDLIENNRRRIGLLEEAARHLYKDWFVRFRYPGHEHVKVTDGVPERWVRGRVADLGLAVTGKTPSKNVSENFGFDVPFIKTPDMHGQSLIIATDEWLSERGANSQANKTLPIGSILVSCIGTIGVVAMNAIPAQTNQQINAIIPKQKHWQFFAYFALQSIKPNLEAMGGGATMANVNKSKFENVPIVIADDRLILQFDEAARPLFELIEVLIKQSRQLAKARDLLLPRLMNASVAV